MLARLCHDYRHEFIHFCHKYIVCTGGFWTTVLTERCGLMKGTSTTRALNTQTSLKVMLHETIRNDDF